MSYTTTATIASMSSTGPDSPNSLDVEEPRKKGSRGGKRSVTHLSKAQLARKRANDREAQRNIRQRTKEHIENLERKVKELEHGSRAGSIERVLKRNRELEDEVERLRAQIGQHTPIMTAQGQPEMPEELLIPQKATLEWGLDSASCAWPQAVSHVPVSNHSPEIQTANAPYTTSAQVYPATTTSMGYNDESSHHMYTPTETWANPAFGPPTTSQNISKPLAAWSPMDPTFSQPSRFPDMQISGFHDLVNQHNYSSSICWQNQPSTYSWQISTKLKTPVTYLDQLMFSVIQSQRHIASTGDAVGEELMGPSLPSVHQLFNHPGPVEANPSNMTKVMDKYSAVLANRGFPLIPEKLASFMCMYRFIQWQISPTYETFQTLHEWQAPRPSQLLIPHPAWMDLAPWGKFRDLLIENQAKYDNPTFQQDYASSLSVNFPFDPMKALIFDANGRMMISPVLDKHLSDINNISMKKAFGDKYPEFKEVCRIDEV